MSKYITDLSAKNLKGLTFSHKLNRVNIFVADNEAGKTARLDGILLCQLGYKLKPGKKPEKTAAAIFRSCGCRGGGATELAVSNTMSDGTAIARQWTMQRGKISYQGPDDEFIPPLMLDPSGFFALSGPEKRNHVLRQCDLAKLGLGYEPLTTRLNPLFASLNSTDAGRLATGEVTAEISRLDTERHFTQQTVYDWLAVVVDSITKLKDTAASQAETHEQTVKGLTDGKAHDGDMTAIQSVQPEINAARDRHTAAVQAEATAQAALQQAEQSVRQCKALADTVVEETVIQKRIAKGQKLIEELRQTPAPGPRPEAKPMATARPDNTAAQTAHRAAVTARDDADYSLRQAGREVESLQQAITAAKAQTTCPTCGHDITASQAAVVAGLQAELVSANSIHKQRLTAYGTAENAAKAAADALATIGGEITAWDAAQADLRRANQAALDLWDAAHRAHTDAQTKINTYIEAIQRLRDQIAGNQAARDAAAKLPSLQQAAWDAGQARQQAHDALEPIMQEIHQLETQQRNYIARTQDARRADQSREMLQTAKDRLAVFKAALKVVAGEKERAATDAFKELLAQARLFTDGNLRAPLEYRDGEIGMTADGNWVEISEFSGKQQIFALAGLGVALTKNNQGVRLVMVDEMGRLTAANKVKLVNRLLELIHQGVIDQACLCDVSSRDYPTNPDINLIPVDNGTKAG